MICDFYDSEKSREFYSMEIHLNDKIDNVSILVEALFTLMKLTYSHENINENIDIRNSVNAKNILIKKNLIHMRTSVLSYDKNIKTF